MNTSPTSVSVDIAAVGASRFKLGMRRLAAGVSLVTSAHHGVHVGFIATSVTSVSAEPPTLLVCANRATTAHDPIDASGVFCVNLLGRGDEDICAQFSSSRRRNERFRDGEWAETGTGSRALASAMAWFDCIVEHRIRHYSHTIFLARVIETRLGDTAEALVYFEQRYL
jgi:flavin reductase